MTFKSIATLRVRDWADRARAAMSRFGSAYSRSEDMRMLREVLETERLDPRTRESFSDMLHELSSGERWCLSTDQRDWLKKFAEPSYENLASRKLVSTTVRHRHKELAPCTPACPAWKPPTLVNLPKRPPGRA